MPWGPARRIVSRVRSSGTDSDALDGENRKFGGRSACSDLWSFASRRSVEELCPYWLTS